MAERRPLVLSASGELEQLPTGDTLPGGGGTDISGTLDFIDKTSLLTNPDFETGDLTGWTTADAGGAVLAWAASSYDGASMATLAKNGTYILYGVADPSSHYYQDVNIESANMSNSLGFRVNAEALKDFSDTDVASVELELLGAGGQILAKDTAEYDGSAIGWQKLQCFVWNDSTAVTIRIRIKLTRNTGTNNNCAIDNITLASANGADGTSLVEMSFKGFRATTAATQAYASGTLEVNWGTELFDTEAAFASGRFTVPASLNGYYAVFNTGLVFSTDEDGEILLQRSTDAGGTWPTIITQTSMTGAGGAESVGSGPVLLTTGEVYRVAIVMTSGATILDEDRNHFSAQFFAPDATGTVLKTPITTSQSLTDAHFAGNVYQEVDTTAGNVTLTIPDTLTGLEPCFFENIGTNDLIFAAGGTTTINSKASALTVADQFAGATVMPKGSDVYSLIGDLS